MTHYPPPTPTPPPPAREPFYRDARLILWLVLIGALITVGVLRQRGAAQQQPSAAEVSESAAAIERSDHVAGPATPSASAAPLSPRQQPTSSSPKPSTAATVAASTAAPAPADDFLFTMPDFTGLKLQNAQNTVQGLGVRYSRSHDLRGSRRQVLDRNWKVCAQNLPAGTRVTGRASDLEGKIDFGVVKTSEDCP